MYRQVKLDNNNMNKAMKEIQTAIIIGSAPTFLVADLVKSAEYYRDSLGFTYPMIWGEPPGILHSAQG